jgi:diguanylate cyclase (GGDEF)-like protein
MKAAGLGQKRDHEMVLMVDDEPQVLNLLKRVLERAGFETVAVSDGRLAHDAAVDQQPDIILLDLLLGPITGDHVLQELREDFRTRLIPVVVLTVRSSLKDKIEHLMAGADDYVTKPFIGEELVARLRAVMTRAKTARGLSPLTGMSGNTDIQREITNRLMAGDEFALLYPDIDSFKSYNDHYGFIRGDDVITTLASVIQDVLGDNYSTAHFAGHIGGDDFVILTERQFAERIAAEVTTRFDRVVPTLYDEVDRERGWIEFEDRAGDKQMANLVSVSVGVVTVEPGQFTSPAAIAVRAARRKAELKQARAAIRVGIDRGRRAADRSGEPERGRGLASREVDVRNLLAVILDYSQLVGEEGADQVAVMNDIAEIRIAAERALSLMQEDEDSGAEI